MRLLFAIPIVLLPNTAHLPPDVALSVSIACLGIAALLGDRDPQHLARPGYLMPALIALLIAMTIGFVAAQWDDMSSLGGDLRAAKVAVLYPLLYLAYRRSGLGEAATRQLMVLVLLVATAAGLEAVIQGLNFDLGAFSETQRATGPFGPINMANRAGVFFAMFLPIFIAFALQKRQRKWVRAGAAACSVVLATAILFTYSRQAYLIALFGIMILLVWRSIPVAVLAAIVLLAGAAAFLPGSVLQRVQDTQQVGAGGEVALDVSTTSRFAIWRGTLDMVREHPFGVGLGRFNDHIGDYTTYAGKDAHNGFVLMLAECGPLGLLALLWVVWRLWRLARWLRRGAARMHPDNLALERGFTLAVVSMALGNMYGSAFFDSLIMSNFWILCGLIERYATMKAFDAELVAYAKRPGRSPLPVGKRFPLAARALPGLAKGKELTH